MEPIKAFSNVVIGQFALTKIPIKVYVNGRYLTITSTDDIQDPLIGFGMDEDGQMQRYDYRTIEHLSVAGNVVDLDTYNSAIGAGEEAEETEEEPEKEESVQMTEISKDVLKAKLKATNLEIKALKDKEKELKSQPIEDGIEEELYQGEYTFGTGDIVKNIHPECEHFGSIGVVKKTYTAEDGRTIVVYTVGNSGPTYKPGMALEKPIDQMEMYNG